MQGQEFQQLPIPRQSFQQAMAGNYRVYGDDGKFVIVTAMSALEALQSCGVANVQKIERDSLDLTKVFAPKDWSFDKPQDAEASAAPAQAVPQVEAPHDVVEVPLSGDDVNKLLNT